MSTSTLEMRPSPAYTIPATVGTLGLYRLWLRRTRYAVTAEAVRVERGILRRREEEVPLQRIANVRLRLSPWPGASGVELATGAGEWSLLIPHLNRREARRLETAISEGRAAEKAHA